MQHGRARTRLFELSLRFVDRLEEIANDPDIEPKDVIAAARLCFDRVFPTVARVHQTGTVQHNVNLPDVDWAEIHRRAVERVDRRDRGNGSTPDPRIH